MIIVGACTRAAAWSACRSGFDPWCIDQFCDLDLCEIAEETRRVVDWPASIRAAIAEFPDSSWLYTGALENEPELIEELSRSRQLLGCDASSLALLRDPFRLAKEFCGVGINVLRLCEDASGIDQNSDWISKPFRSAAGFNIRRVSGDSCLTAQSRRDIYLQEYVRGEAASGLFLATKDETRFLGMSRQLSGCSETGATKFLYCGSIAPVDTGEFGTTSDGSADIRRTMSLAGETAAGISGLRGLFGIDFVIDSRNGTAWPLEVNPRYPASAELYELAHGWPLVKWHVDACCDRSIDFASSGIDDSQTGESRRSVFGKVIVYAPVTLSAPDVRLLAVRRQFSGVTVADIPHPGSVIARGCPVCTLIGQDESSKACRSRLLELAEITRRWLADFEESEH